MKRNNERSLQLRRKYAPATTIICPIETKSSINIPEIAFLEGPVSSKAVFKRKKV